MPRLSRLPGEERVEAVLARRREGEPTAVPARRQVHRNCERRLDRGSPATRCLSLTLLGLGLVAMGCRWPSSKDRIFSVVARRHLIGTMVRLDGSELGKLEPPWDDEFLAHLSGGSSAFVEIDRDLAQVPLQPGPEHTLEVLRPDGRIQSVEFRLVRHDQPRLFNCGFNRDGSFACIVTYPDGSSIYFPEQSR